MKIRALFLILGLALVAGCGSKSTSLEGKVMNGSQAYTPSKDGDLNIVLTSESGGKTYSGKAEEDGTFKIASIPAGSYAVSVTRYPRSDEKPKGDTPPMPANKNLDEKWEVSSSSRSFTLDITKLK